MKACIIRATIRGDKLPCSEKAKEPHTTCCPGENVLVVGGVAGQGCFDPRHHRTGDGKANEGRSFLGVDSLNTAQEELDVR